MASDEQFSLCWNNFHSNMSTGFHGLLSRGDLVDVTLAAEGRMLQAHKIVLSVCSPYFQDLFKMNPTQHPIVFLKDVSYTVLKDLLQFMYQGEVNVKQEELASFISTAEQLQVKGLTGNQTDDGVPTPKPKPSPRPGPRSSQQRQAIKPETDVDTKQNPVAIKRPSRPSATPSNASSSQPAPAKRKCIDPLEPGPSGNSKDDFVTIADEDDNAAVAPKMEPEFNDALWEDDDDGTNNDDGNFGEDDSNLEMSGFGDGSVTGDTTIAGATGEGGAVGDAQDPMDTESSAESVSPTHSRRRTRIISTQSSKSSSESRQRNPVARNRPTNYNTISQDKKNILIKSYEVGKTINESAEIAGIKKSTARAIIKRFRENGEYTQKNRGGKRNVKITPEILDEIEKIVEENPTITLKNICKKILECKNVNLSIASVQNGLKKLRITLKCNP
ncbi:uncharacterized protein LOC143919269 isoform X2 [Arctopsyche grandis]|uniref:uncharacterized protein LOC143919269 isoform X2 n=1 Tax=Arctopsyche grandis TaxID=121162 RepID=UPI00406D7647